MKKVLICALLLAFAGFSYSASVSQEEIDKKRKDRDTTTRIIIKTGKFVEDVREEKDNIRAATSVENERGYILFSRNYSEMIFHNSVPTEKDGLKCVSFGSPGEYIPLTFSVYPLKDLRSAKVSSSGLSSGKDNIGPENFEARTVWHMPKRTGPHIFRMNPWLMEKKDTMDILAGEKTLWGAVKAGPTREWWITVKIPEDAKPGLYKGTIEFVPANSAAASVPVEIEVLPIKLASPKNFNMWFFDDPNIRNDNFVKSLKEHGVYGYDIGLRNLQVSAEGIDFKGFEEDADLALNKGLNGSFLIYAQPLSHAIADALKTKLHSPVFVSEGRKMIERFNKQVKDKYGEKVEIFYFGIDEPGNSEERRRELTPLIKWLKTIEGVTVVETLNGPDIYKLYAQYTDVNWSYALWPELDRAFLAGNGKRLSLNVWIDSGSILHARLEPGLFPWKNNYSALKMWSFNSASGDPLNDLDGGDPDWCLTGPCENDTEDIMPSVNYEAMRKGIDDRRYVVTLEQLIEKAKSNPELAGKAGAAKKLLESFGALIPDTRTKLAALKQDVITFEKLEAFKREVANKIIELEAAEK